MCKVEKKDLSSDGQVKTGDVVLVNKGGVWAIAQVDYLYDETAPEFAGEWAHIVEGNLEDSVSRDSLTVVNELAQQAILLFTELGSVAGGFEESDAGLLSNLLEAGRYVAERNRYDELMEDEFYDDRYDDWYDDWYDDDWLDDDLMSGPVPAALQLESVSSIKERHGIGSRELSDAGQTHDQES